MKHLEYSMKFYFEELFAGILPYKTCKIKVSLILNLLALNFGKEVGWREGGGLVREGE